LFLLLFLGAIQFSFAQTSQNYDMGVGGEKYILNPQNKGLETFKEKETDGKLVKYFMDKFCPPNPNKEAIYLGPFNPNLISGKQDNYTCYHFDAMKHTTMGVPKGFYYKYLTDFLI